MSSSREPSSGRVAVFVRCRPPPLLQSRQKHHHLHQCVQLAPSSGQQKILLPGANKEFVFDRIFDEDSSQLLLFESTVLPLLPDCFEGFNLTVLAYGQTGSGKTHTMGSSVGLLATDDEGLIPRVLRHVFNHVEATTGDQKEEAGCITNLRLSFVEIYNEEIRDLLHPEIPSKDIGLREDSQGRMFFVGAREEAVSTLDQAFSFLDKGCLSRTTGDTLMNATSSRSHAIFTINIEVFDSKHGSCDSDKHVDKEVVHSYTQAKISLVDLAGSERAKRTGASGTRLKESVGINQGLLSLGKVIRALTSSPSKGFVPYRESKLTRFLQDSLGGNSRTLMFACVSKSNADLHETLTTLQYAMRARSVQNKIVANVMLAPATGLSPLMEDSVVDALRQQLNSLQAKLQAKEAEEHQVVDKSTLRLQVQCPSQDAKDHLVKQIVYVQRTISDGVLFFDESLESGKVTLINTGDTAAELEGRLNDMHGTVAVLDEVREKVVLAPCYEGDIHAEGMKPSKDVSLTVASLEKELLECKDDLKRDEEIFREKVNELNKFRRALRQNQEEKNGLEAQLSSMSRKVDDLQFQLDNVHSEKKAEKNDNNEDSNSDILEVSMAVAATEPHISQLMEDLELISREKEVLSNEKQLVEHKYDQAASAAQQQKEEFEASRVELQKELKHLEIGIRMKEECIRTITREQKNIVSKSDMYALRIAELERERSELTSELQNKTNSSSSEDTKKPDEGPNSEFEEGGVQTLHRKYQDKLRLLQDEINTMRSEWAVANNSQHSNSAAPEKINVHASISDNLLTDLKAMKSEHRRLLSVIEGNEESQKDKLDTLLTELQGYREASQISQQHISHLEAKNSALQTEIRRFTDGNASKAGLQLLPPPPGHKEGYLQRHKTQTGEETTSPPHCEGLVFCREEDVKHPYDLGIVKSVWGWIDGRLDAEMSEKLVEEEKTDFIQRCSSITEDEHLLNDELRELESKQSRGETDLARLCEEMDSKMLSTRNDLSTLHISQKKIQQQLHDVIIARNKASRNLKKDSPDLSQESLEDLEMRLLQHQIDEQDVTEKIKKCEASLTRFTEHKSELMDRLNRGVLKPSETNRMMEIKEDLEAFAAERQVFSSSDQGLTTRDTLAPTSSLLKDVLSAFYRAREKAHVPEYGAGGAISYLISNILNCKILCDKTTQLAEQHQLALDEKSEQFEHLAMTLHRTRTDLGKKLERQKSDYEDKISFLLMQLRGAELQAQSNSTLLRKSIEKRGQRRQQSSVALSQDDTNGSNQHRISSSALGYVRPRPRTAQSYIRGGGNGAENEKYFKERSDDVDDSEKYNSLLRKYKSEKERREMLEKRNVELARELRLQKKNNI